MSPCLKSRVVRARTHTRTDTADRNMQSSSAPTAATASTAPAATPAATTNVKRKKSHKRQKTTKITVYDVVASRVNAEGFIKPAAFRSEVEEIRFRSGVARPADEVLGRRFRAPDNVAPVDEEKCSKLLPNNVLYFP